MSRRRACKGLLDRCPRKNRRVFSIEIFFVQAKVAVSSPFFDTTLFIPVKLENQSS